MITNGTEIVILDHELAFSFIFDLFQNPRPWEIRNADFEWIKKHFLLPKIKGRQFNFDGLSQRLDGLNADFWDIARNLIPVEWQSDQFDIIKQHLTVVCNNRDAFIFELKKLMS